MYVYLDVAKKESVHKYLKSWNNSHEMPQLIHSAFGPINAVPFYRKHGYEKVTEQTLEYNDVIEVTVKEMKKKLE